MWNRLILGLGILLATSTAAFASTPDELAARCVTRMNHVVERLEVATAEETTECVQRINELQAAGRDAAARELAAACVRAATERARNAAALINRVCDACVEELVTLGEFELARRVDNACDNALFDVREILQRSKSAIADALAD